MWIKYFTRGNNVVSQMVFLRRDLETYVFQLWPLNTQWHQASLIQIKLQSLADSMIIHRQKRKQIQVPQPGPKCIIFVCFVCKMWISISHLKTSECVEIENTLTISYSWKWSYAYILRWRRELWAWLRVVDDEGSQEG